jgi:hypothetical protein
LKQEVIVLKEQGPVTSALAVSSNKSLESMTKEEVTAKLISYQQFMSKYIVEAHQQKVEAVRDAQLAVAKKYEAKLLLLSAASGVQLETTAEAGLYQERSANVSAAAAAGKSRWGDMENARAAEAIGVNGATASASSSAPVAVPALTPTATSLYDKRNARIAAAAKVGKSRWSSKENERAFQLSSGLPSIAAVPATVVEEADHGLRADGGVGGPTLADRLNAGQQLLASNGAAAPASTSVTAVAGGFSLYDKRNARIAAAAKVGKSRWGNMENDRAFEMASSFPALGGSSTATPPEVEEADHGLRADGGIGGPTLAQRVNLGASLLGP